MKQVYFAAVAAVTLMFATQSVRADTYLDELNAIAYNGNDGDVKWSGDWQEAGESSSPTAGFVRVVSHANCTLSNCLRFGHADSDVSQRILSREADLSGSATWTFSYDYVTASSDRGFVHVEISGDGGSTWSQLTSFNFEDGNVSGSASFDVSSFAAANTQIRFRLVNDENDPNDTDQIRGLLYVDDIQIESSGGTELLLVVGDSSSLGTGDTLRKALVESWGYSVTVIDDSDSQANFDTALGQASVAYISESTLSTDLGTKMRDTVIGVVNEEGGLYDEFGISSGAFVFKSTSTNIVDNTHYITSPFSVGSLTITTSTQVLVQLDGTLAGGIDSLAVDFGWPSLSALDTGGALYGGGTAAGRRVQLPWGNTPFDFSTLNSNGQTILKRALEWGEFDHSAGGGDHFVITHDANAIHCLAETITVRVEDVDDNPVTTYTETVTLDTQSGRGTWSLVAGSGTLTDATANDGLANYTWSNGESEAQFSLNYTEGTASINIDAYQANSTSVRDDDSEGTLDFTPSGFTLTASALSNPPPGAITTFANAQMAGTDFTVYVAAYGQTPTDTQCGIIETYAGEKKIGFWSTYINPASGTLVPSVDGAAIGASEAAAVTAGLTFTSGQASFTTKYKDSGSIRLELKDDNTGNPDLSTGMRGATSNFVVRPFEFELSAIEDGASNANPAAADSSGLAFVTAGESFAMTVTALDAEGDTTPNYGQESPSETIIVTPNIIDPAAGQNPAMAGTFGSFVAGSTTGTAFSWPEVGIITVTPEVGDGNYLGAGNIVGTTSANVGRFIADHFTTTINSPTLATACASGSFTYIGQSFGYSNAPVITATARALAGTVTENYAGGYFKMDNSSLPDAVYTSTPATLDTSGVPGGTSDPAVASLGAGVGTLTFSSGTGMLYTQGTETDPFGANIELSLSIVDADGATAAVNPVTFGDPAGILFDGGSEMRFGRARLVNSVGSELVNLNLPFTTEYFVSSSIGFVTNTDDSCTAGVTLTLGSYTENLQDGETCVLDNGFPGSSSSGCAASAPAAAQYREPPLGGDFNLYLQAPGDSNDGSVEVTGTVPGWLQYDWDSGASGLENPAASAVFGIYNGEGKQIYLREIY